LTTIDTNAEIIGVRRVAQRVKRRIQDLHAA